VEGGFNGVALQIGLAGKFFWEYAGEVPLVLKLNGKTDIPSPPDPVSPVNATVEEAVRLGADAVGYTLYVGTPGQERDFAQYLRVREDAERFGMRLIVWSYPRGAAIDAKGGKDSFYAVDYAARTASELGADMVKVNFPQAAKQDGVPVAYRADFWPQQAIEAVVRSAGRSLLLVSGGEHARGGGHAGEGTRVDGRGRHRPHLRPQRLPARPRRIAPLRRPAQGDPGQVPLVAESHGRLPGPGGWSVAVQHLGLVLVPGGGGPVGVQHQGPALPVDRDLVMEGAQQHAVFGAGLAAVGFVPGVVHLAG
jgi:DeoC/LacD family aldolase